MVEFHAEVPEKGRANVRGDRYRVKHHPSLHERGFHGRTNEEASGCHLFRYPIELGDLRILLPNPVTWSVMKLTAMADMFNSAQEHWEDEKERRFFDEQARKHAADVCRILAMTSREESESAGEVIAFLRGSMAFSKAAAIAKDYFSGEDGWGTMTTEGAWTPEDHQEIRNRLLRWFGEE